MSPDRPSLAASLLLLCAASAVAPGDLSLLDKPEPLYEVRGAVGRSASLPCAVTPRAGPRAGQDDAPQMLLWYSDAAPDSGVPVYRADARGRPLSQARLWSSASWFGQRARLLLEEGPGPHPDARPKDALVHLQVHPLHEGDHGLYRCRVDFKDAPTRNSRVSLFVTVPPTQLVVTWWPPPGDGSAARRGSREPQPVSVLPPLSEGDQLTLVCRAIGGRPRPSVEWLLDGEVLSDSWRADEDGEVVNRLVVPALGRQHLHGRLVCRAANNPDALPTERELHLDLLLRPLSVRIVVTERVFLAGQDYELQCRCSGSRPAARIAWRWKGGEPAVRGAVKKLAGSSSDSVSLLTLTPRAEDDGRVLECRADNALFPDSELRDERRLTVEYPPRTTVRLGPGLNASRIKEGDDLYLECLVDAKPDVDRLVWTHDDVELQPGQGHRDGQHDVILTGRTLVMRHVARLATGRYACSAHNARGWGRSPEYALGVLYAPECRRKASDAEALLGALPRETVTLSCDVDALPAPRSFRWTFNESSKLPASARARGSSTALAAELVVTPTGPDDYGEYACWAEENGVGHQARPCVTRLVAAGPPLPPANCSMARLLVGHALEGAPPPSLGAEQPAAVRGGEDADEGALREAGALLVDCRPPPPSGLPQRYQLLLLREPLAALLLNVTLEAGAPPVWKLAWAPEPGVAYSVHVHALNAKGTSEATVLEGGPLRGPEPLEGVPSEEAVLHGLVAACCGLLLLATVALLCLVACRPRRPRNPERPDGAPAAATSLLDASEDHADPDVIPMSGVPRAAPPRPSASRTPRKSSPAGETPPPPRRGARRMEARASRNGGGGRGGASERRGAGQRVAREDLAAGQAGPLPAAAVEWTPGRSESQPVQESLC